MASGGLDRISASFRWMLYPQLGICPDDYLGHFIWVCICIQGFNKLEAMQVPYRHTLISHNKRLMAYTIGSKTNLKLCYKYSLQIILVDFMSIFITLLHDLLPKLYKKNWHTKIGLKCFRHCWWHNLTARITWSYHWFRSLRGHEGSTKVIQHEEYNTYWNLNYGFISHVMHLIFKPLKNWIF